MASKYRTTYMTNCTHMNVLYIRSNDRRVNMNKIHMYVYVLAGDFGANETFSSF